MPENEGPGPPGPRGFGLGGWQTLAAAAGAGLLGLILVLFAFCDFDQGRGTGTTGSDGAGGATSSPQVTNELEPTGTGPVPTGTATGTPGAESPFDFAVLDGTYHLVFTEGDGNCGLVERFKDDVNLLIQGVRIFTEQASTGQRTQGRFDPDTKRFETRGESSGHVEIYQGRFTAENRFRGNYSLFDDCEQHWELTGQMRRG
jgi:hypothetical protein